MEESNKQKLTKTDKNKQNLFMEKLIEERRTHIRNEAKIIII